MTFIALKHDPCPQCGKEVTHHALDNENDMWSMFNDHSVPPPAEILLLPCGHNVGSYTIDTIHGTVKWNTLTP